MDDKVQTEAGDVSVRVDGEPAGPLLVLAHGAGAGMHHPFMTSVAQGLAQRGITVVRFNFAYTEQTRKRPDRQSVLEATFAEVAGWARSSFASSPMVLGGKSMGGRIASHLASASFDCQGLVFLGYPLHPPGRPERIRDDHLYGIEAPMLFVQGTRDPFCPLERLADVRNRLSGQSSLLVIQDGDHSFHVPKSSGRSDAEALEQLISGVGAWIGGIVDDSESRL